MQLGLLAIGDPGVITDIYRYCKFYQLIKTLNKKTAVFQSFKRWYDTARDEANESYALEKPDVNKAYKLFKTHYAQLVHNYNLERLQTINQCIEIEDRLITAKNMGRLEAILPQILHTVRESGASRTFWGEIPSTITYPSLPDPIPTASPEPVFIPLPPGTSPALGPTTPSVSPTPSFLLADQVPPSSGPICRGHTHTPPCMKDRAKNDSSQQAPSHMQKMHSPHSSPPHPATSVTSDDDPLVSLPPLTSVLWNLEQMLDWSRMLTQLYHGTPGFTVTN